MPDLTVDENHIYRLDGRRLIGVTEALSILDDRWKIDPWYLDRGIAIHLACEYWDKGTLDDETIGPDIYSYLKAYRRFLLDTGFEPNIIERPLCDTYHMFAGKPDRIGILNHKSILLDLKSGNHNSIDELQGAAYWELCRVNQIEVKRVFDLYLKNDGNYLFREVEKPKLLLPVFFSCLQIYRWREQI